MTPMKKLNEKYDQALLAMFDLFKYGRNKEMELELKIELLEDELKRIKACSGSTEEIKGICHRGLGYKPT